MKVALRSKSFQEFIESIDQYQGQCRARNRKVALMLGGSLAPSAIWILLVLRKPVPELVYSLPTWFGGFVTMGSVGLVSLLLVYIVFTSRGAHEASSPKCQSCHKSMGAIQELQIAEWKLAVEPVQVKCKHCGFTIAQWNPAGWRS